MHPMALSILYKSPENSAGFSSKYNMIGSLKSRLRLEHVQNTIRLRTVFSSLTPRYLGVAVSLSWRRPELIKRVLELKDLGYGVRSIANIIREEFGVDISKSSVHRIVKAWEEGRIEVGSDGMPRIKRRLGGVVLYQKLLKPTGLEAGTSAPKTEVASKHTEKQPEPPAAAEAAPKKTETVAGTSARDLRTKEKSEGAASWEALMVMAATAALWAAVYGPELTKPQETSPLGEW